MKHEIRAITLVAVGISVLAVGLANRGGAARGAEKATHNPVSHKAVVVELFTSEGCSSCPPADTLLRTLQKRGSVDGAQIVALSEHVDYWNNGGWRDPYSAAKFSQRQSDYARTFRLDSVYTPQMVIDGQAEFVGSDDVRADAAIARAARAAKADVTITRSNSKPFGGTESSDAIPLHISVTGLTLPSGAVGDVMLAITENNLRSQVVRGENAGRRLEHTAVTRLLKPIGRLDANGTFSGEISVPAASGWKRADLSAVAFVQERGSHHIRGAALLPLGSE